MSRRLLLAAAGVLALALGGGCATDNPREGGFLGGLGGLASGKYEDRVRTRQESLESLKAARTDIESEKTGLETRKGESERRLKAEQQKISRLQTETRKLSDKVGIDLPVALTEDAVAVLGGFVIVALAASL